MNKLLNRRGKIVLISLVSLLLVALLVCGGWLIWLYQQPKFHDLTIELGTESITLRDFMTQHANASKVGFVSDPASIDLNQAGVTQLTLRHGRQQETVTLTVQDTTAPQAEFVDRYAVYSNQAIPAAEDLVVSVEDLSPCTVTYAHTPEFPADYSQQTVTLLVTDASGNQIQGQVTMVFRWLLESYTIELGQTLTKADLLLNPQKDEARLNQAEIDAVNSGNIGVYTITSQDGSAKCEVSLVDTTAPDLQLKDLECLIGRRVSLSDFIVSVEDLAGIKEVRLLTTLDFSREQTYSVTIEAEDNNGNITTKQATLSVVPDRVPPHFTGDISTMNIEKNSTPDFLLGVGAYDDVSGECEVTCDASGVDVSKAGTYYVTYYAKDARGNRGVLRRKVIVLHDSSDTAAAVQEFAATLPNDAEKIRNWVRSRIHYHSDWGGDDPVWTGLIDRRGNCYVFAKTFQALLNAKGFETQIIHVTDYSHYWLLVKLNGSWKHMDATPGVGHAKYSIMNDQQRYETLNGRDWDRSQWPVCE